MADRHHLELRWRDGREASLRVDEDETVLDTAESAGLGLPFGCRTGACSTCVGRLLDGEIAYVRPPRALKQHHRQGGYVLCCIARTLTDCRIAVGTAIQSDRLSHPWR